jgi:RNA polymerase sigma factor (sigma-70 family)
MLFLYTDKELIADLTSRNVDLNNKAFRYLYEHHYHVAEKITREIFKNTTEAADIFQESIIAFYENLRNNQYKGESSVKTYLYSIIKNRAHIRKLKNRIIQKTEKKYWRLSAESFEITKEIDTNHIEIKEYIALSLMDQLNDKCKELLTLCYFEKMSMDEIATNLNYGSAAVVRVQKHRCLQKLVAFISKSPVTKSSIIEVI